MHAGMTLAERSELRAKLRDDAIRKAALMNLTLRCRFATENNLGREYHEPCAGERSGSGYGGCLCTCHDRVTAGEVLATMEGKT